MVCLKQRVIGHAVLFPEQQNHYSRLMSAGELEEGMCLARSIYTEDNQILLSEGISLTGKMIERIRKFGITNIYITGTKGKYNPERTGRITEASPGESEIISEINIKAVNVVRSVLFNSKKSLIDMARETNIKDKAMQEQMSKGIWQYLGSVLDVHKRMLENALSKKAVISSLSIIKGADLSTYDHCVNVAILSLALGLSIDLNGAELYNLFIGAILHDIGKILIPKEIIMKNGKLSDREFEIVKQHTTKGYEYMRKHLDVPEASRIIALQHHERFDGRGYPYGYEGNNISILARIVSVADVYDALISNRPHRKAISFNEATEYILACGGTQLDYNLVLSFGKAIMPYSKGMLVRLSNGRIGFVEETYPDFPLRPKIRLLPFNDPKSCYVDLRQNLNIVISDVLHSGNIQI